MNIKNMSAKSFAAHHNVNIATVYRWALAGMPHTKGANRQHSIDVEKATAWLVDTGRLKPRSRCTDVVFVADDPMDAARFMIVDIGNVGVSAIVFSGFVLVTDVTRGESTWTEYSADDLGLPTDADRVEMVKAAALRFVQEGAA